MYDFDTLYLRNAHASEKWDAAIQQGCPPEIAPLTVADMEFRTAPEIIEAVKQTAEFGLWGYTYANAEFKQTVSNWMQHRHNWPAQADWLVNATGVVPALYTAVRAFTKPGDTILVQPPVYPPFFKAALNNGRKIAENPLVFKNGQYQMDFEDLRRKAPGAAIMILCSPHNPVGRVWSQQDLETIAEICAENNVLLFSDEIHCDIIMPGNKFVSAGALPVQYLQNMVIATSASKTFSLAGLGCCSLFIPNPQLRAQFTTQQDIEGGRMNSTFGVVATQAAYQKAEAWLEELLPYIKNNYDYLQQFMQQNLPLVKVMPMQGTYLAWVNFAKLEQDPDKLETFLREKANLFVNNGSMFGAGGAGFARINLACPNQVLQKALARLQAAVQ
ncbi:pyridoxal phosphate-dependent aminotransferase [Ruminococcaceae bacterium OttesenSCG-928-A16]|nr:pyridoxal phosphate-dependent aminotransferase [Ruminococcaceae bacterium OttesenSCG-928-A16]